MAPATVRFGTTYSPSHAAWTMDNRFKAISWQEALSAVHELNLKRLRIAVPWRDCDEQLGLAWLSDMLKQVDHSGVSITIASGLKTPRWPENYPPTDLLAAHPLPERSEFTDVYRPALEAWWQRLYTEVHPYLHLVEAIQVENEPRDFFGEGDRRISLSMLQWEMALVHSLFHHQQIVTTVGALGGTPAMLYGYSGVNRKWREMLALAPSNFRLGLNLYQKTFWHGLRLSASPQAWKKFRHYVQSARDSHLQPFVSELQAEPWDSPQRFDYHEINGNPTCRPEQVEAMIRSVLAAGITDIDLWGLEFWLRCRQRSSSGWMAHVKQLVQKYQL